MSKTDLTVYKTDNIGICMSNNFLLATYDSSDPVKKKVMNMLIKCYSDVLAIDKYSLENGNDTGLDKIVVNVAQLGIRKDRLFEKLDELEKSTRVRFRFCPPGGRLTERTGPMFIAVDDIVGTPEVELRINPAIIPYLRWAGYDNEIDNYIGWTVIPERLFNIYEKPFTQRIFELIQYMEQHCTSTIRHTGGMMPKMKTDWFIEHLGVPNVYRRPSNLKKRIIDPALMEIMDKTGVEYVCDFMGRNEVICRGTMKNEYIRFTRYYSFLKNDSLPHYSSCTSYIIDYLGRNMKDRDWIMKVAYMLRDSRKCDALYNDLTGMQRQGMPEYKVFKSFVGAINLELDKESGHQHTGDKSCSGM